MMIGHSVFEFQFCRLILLLKLLLLLLLTNNAVQSTKISCRNEITGDELDWFTLYKLPREHHHESDDSRTRIRTRREESSISESQSDWLREGTAYAYMTSSRNEQKGWRLAATSFNDSVSSMPAKTLDAFYSAKKKSNSNSTILGYILYNDETPDNKVSMSRGHTKGMVLFDNETAVWIVHSVPKYPVPFPPYLIHHSQCIFGQSMLCVTLSLDQLEQVGNQLWYNNPQVYDQNVPDHLARQTRFSRLVAVARRGEHVANEEQQQTKTNNTWSNTETLKTLGGEEFLSFAKYTKFEADLYKGLVAPRLATTLLTETWSNGVGTLPSDCSEKAGNVSEKFNVMNVEEIRFAELNVNFTVHKDHSKWAISARTTNDDLKNKNNVCIGDINRQREQFKRGGGTVCFLNNPRVWSEYNRIVDSFQGCTFHI